MSSSSPGRGLTPYDITRTSLLFAHFLTRAPWLDSSWPCLVEGGLRHYVRSRKLLYISLPQTATSRAHNCAHVARVHG